MNQKNESPRELKFVCPKCGSNSLWAHASGCLEIKHVYENSVIKWDEMRPEEICDYHCGSCAYELELGDEKGISEWLIAHCNQDESDVAQSEEDHSRRMGGSRNNIK